MLGLAASFSVAHAAFLAAEEAPAGSEAAPLLAPAVVLLLCVFAGIGTYLVLPSRTRDVSYRRIGAAMMAAGLLILVAILARTEAGMGAYFWIFSAIALLGAVRVITHPKPVYSALYFVLTVFATAGLFVLLQAEFMAAALVLIYAGAILITYVFVIMLASQSNPSGSTAAYISEVDSVSREPLIGAIVGFALMGVLLFVIFDRGNALKPREPAPNEDSEIAKVEGGTQKLGVYLFIHQTVNLELAGLILTISMVGAIVIARKRVVYHDTQTSTRPELTVAPATPIDDNPFSIPVYGTTNAGQKAYPES